MYRISVTTLEKFRRYMSDTSSYDTEDSLLESLMGVFKGSDKTMTGSAYHKIIEKPGGKDISFVHDGKYMAVDNIAFPVSAAQKAIDFHEAHPLMMYETPVKKVYNTQFGPMLVSGRIDGLEGIQVYDHKTKYRPISDISDYTDSCQWKFYLDIMGLKMFLYNIFEFKKFKGFDIESVAKDIVYLDGIEVVHHEPIICYSYLKMQTDCENILNEFFKYIDFRNYWHLLKEVDPVTHETIGKEEVPAAI